MENTQTAQTVQKKDFIELKFTGYANNEIFDSNIEEDLKKMKSDAKPEKMIVIVGEGIVVPGLDKALEGKEIGKEYTIEIKSKDGFGERKRELMKTIPLSIFTAQQIAPRAGMALMLDNFLVRIIAVSGARVVTDFNNPLAGKDLSYKFKVAKKIEDEKEKIGAFFELFLRVKPEFEIKESVIVKGPKNLDLFVNAFKEKFKDLIGKELKFELLEKENKKKETEEKIAQ